MGSMDRETGVIKVVDSTTPGVPDGFYRIPIKYMDLVQNPAPGSQQDIPQPVQVPSRLRDPYDTRRYGLELDDMISLINSQKQSGPSRPEIDLGPDWEEVSFQDYLKKFIDQHMAVYEENLPKFIDLQIKNVDDEIKKQQDLLQQVELSIQNMGNKKIFRRSEAKQLALYRDYLSAQLGSLNDTLNTLYKQKENPELAKKPIQLNKIFQGQLKNNMENTSIYRSGNVTLLVPAEYRNVPEKIQQLSRVIRVLQEKYGTETPVEINLYTRTPGDVIDIPNVTQDQGIWSVAGWTTNNNLAGEILVSLDGQNMLTDTNPLEREGYSMPARNGLPQEIYTLAHEWGHARDFDSGGDESGESPLMASQIAQYFAAHPDVYERLVSEYGKSSVWEATAELFAQLFLQEVFSTEKIDIEQEILDILRQ